MNAWTILHAKTLRDLDWILGELPKFADYHGEQSWMPDLDAQLDQLLYASRSGYLRIAVSPAGHYSGFLMAVMHPHWSNPDKLQATELLWWVVPEARATRAGLMLMQDFTQWAEAHADFVSFSLVGPAGDKALARLGYKYGERVFTKRVER